MLLSLITLGWLLTSGTRYGLNIYAVGGNAEAARRAGIGVLFGGRGSVWAALLGWLVIGSIYSGLFLLNLESDIEYMITVDARIGERELRELYPAGRAARHHA